jgi:predicted transposase YdaD
MQPNAHDALFKATFSRIEHAASALRGILPPALAARVDFRTLALCPGSFVDEALKERWSDLLFSASLEGRPVLLYVLWEHQSTVDELMAYRLLRYLVRIWDSWLKDHPNARRIPPIVPVVLHHSETGWTATTAFEDLLDVDAETLGAIAEHVPRFRFVLEDISHESDQALKARAMTALGRLALWCLRHARDPQVLLDRLGEWVDLVREVRRAPDGPATLLLIWRYILSTNEPKRDPDDVVARLLAAVGEEGKEEIMTAADMLIERGRKEGRKEGRKAERREMLLKLLRARFGALPEAVVARVNATEMPQLDVWLEQVLTAATLADVIGE